MTDAPFSGQPITLVRLRQPACANVFGTSPCTATGEACFQTRSTCKDALNYDGTAEIDLWFGMAGAPGPSDPIYIQPLLISVSSSPARVNVSGSDKRANPLGITGTASIVFADQPHSDLLVDPYRAGRSYDALARGTFWSKWDRRNRVGKLGMEVEIYEGFAGQALAQMSSRLYLAEDLDISGVDRVTLGCRDVMSKIDDEKALAPAASPGALFADINATVLSIEVAGATLEDYPATGTLRINGEVMTYSARAFNAGTGRLTFTLTARGTDGTQAEDHDAEDLVQECLRFTEAEVDAALVKIWEYTTVKPALLDVAGWAAEAAQHLTAYRITGLVTEPTPCKALLGEICEQAQIFTWYNERAKLVRMKAVKPLDQEPRLLTETANIIADSVRVRDFAERRVSSVWIYYRPRDPNAAIDDQANYRRIQIAKTADSLYEDQAIRRIFARFIPSGAVAAETSARIRSRYREVPREISFSVSDRDGDLEIGDIVQIDHNRIQDTTGAPERRLWIITSVDVQHMGRRIDLVAEDATLAGVVLAVAPEDAGDWQGNGSDPFGAMFIGDASGNLPGAENPFLIQ